MKKNTHHKFLLHGQGTGELTDDIVEVRAREIAVIRGRSADRVTEDDRAEAWAELQGELLPPSTESDGESAGAITRDPSEPVSVPGRHIPNLEPDDSSNIEQLAHEGVEEAQHDQMLAAREREHREDRR
jgi:hypothetical protein